MYISFFNNELILYDSFSNILMTLSLAPIAPLSASWKWLVHTAFTGNACPTELQGGKKSNTLNRTMMSQTISPTSLRSPTGTDLVAHHLQHLQQKQSKKLHSVSRNWEHTCQLHEQIQTDLLCHPRVRKDGFCLWRCNSQHSALLLG